MGGQYRNGYPVRLVPSIAFRAMPASLELVKIALKAYGDGDYEIALALSDQNLRWDERASRPDGELVWGHDDVGRAMRRYLGGWESYRFELEDVAEAAPGKVVGICRERGVDGEGVPVDRRFGGLWVVEDAKIVSWSTYLTPKEAVRAARELAGDDARRPRRRPRPVAPAPGRPEDEAPPAQPHAERAGQPPQAAPSPPAAPPPVERDAEIEAHRPVPTERLRAAAKARARLRRQKAAS
jgi:ketosteroid isomerase-like protein